MINLSVYDREYTGLDPQSRVLAAEPAMGNHGLSQPCGPREIRTHTVGFLGPASPAVGLESRISNFITKRRCLTVTIRTKEPEVFYQIIQPVTIYMIYIKGNRLSQPVHY